jgi:hypothetical protein
MRSNHFDSTIFGNTILGQGFINAVEGTHRSALRHLVLSLVRRLSSLASWRASECTPATATPKLAMCPAYAGRRQRDYRVGVVETRGTVGVC